MTILAFFLILHQKLDCCTQSTWNFVPLFWPLTHHYHGSKRYLTKSKYLYGLLFKFSFEGWKQARYKSSKGHKEFCIICFGNMETKPFTVLGKAFLLPGWSGGCICPRGQIVSRVCWNVNFDSHLKYPYMQKRKWFSLNIIYRPLRILSYFICLKIVLKWACSFANKQRLFIFISLHSNCPFSPTIPWNYTNMAACFWTSFSFSYIKRMILSYTSGCSVVRARIVKGKWVVRVMRKPTLPEQMRW